MPPKAQGVQRKNIVLSDATISDIEYLKQRWNASSQTENIRTAVARAKKIEEKLADGYELILRKGDKEAYLL